MEKELLWRSQSYQRKFSLHLLSMLAACSLLASCAGMMWDTPIDPFNGAAPQPASADADNPERFADKTAIVVPSANTREWTANWAHWVKYSGNSDGTNEAADFAQLVNITVAQTNAMSNATGAIQSAKPAQGGAAALAALSSVGIFINASQAQANAFDPRPIISAIDSILLTRFAKTKGAKTLDQAKSDSSCGAIVYIDFQRIRTSGLYMVLGTSLTDEFTANLFFLDCSGHLLRKFSSTQKVTHASVSDNVVEQLALADGPAIKAIWQENLDATAKWLTPPKPAAAMATTQSEMPPSDAIFNACFERCRKMTIRSREQCFDSCKR